MADISATCNRETCSLQRRDPSACRRPHPAELSTMPRPQPPAQTPDSASSSSSLLVGDKTSVHRQGKAGGGEINSKLLPKTT